MLGAGARGFAVTVMPDARAQYRIPTIARISARCPWSPRRSDEAAEATRRIAATWQGREFLIQQIDAKRPFATLAHSTIRLVMMIDAILIEELLRGYLLYRLDPAVEKLAGGRNTARSGLKELLDEHALRGALSKETIGRIDALREKRNVFVHGHHGHGVDANIKSLSRNRLGQSVRLGLPTEVARALRTYREGAPTSG